MCDLETKKKSEEKLSLTIYILMLVFKTIKTNNKKRKSQNKVS